MSPRIKQFVGLHEQHNHVASLDKTVFGLGLDLSNDGCSVHLKSPPDISRSLLRSGSLLVRVIPIRTIKVHKYN